MKGEFEKRITKLFEDFTTQRKYPKIISTDDFSDIVDEARKEFPIFEDVLKEVTEYLKPKYPMLTAEDFKSMATIIHSVRCSQWFVKWFGDEGGEGV